MSQTSSLTPKEYLWAISLLKLHGYTLEEAQKIIDEDVEPKFKQKMEEVGA